MVPFLVFYKVVAFLTICIDSSGLHTTSLILSSWNILSLVSSDKDPFPFRYRLIGPLVIPTLLASSEAVMPDSFSAVTIACLIMLFILLANIWKDSL